MFTYQAIFFALLAIGLNLHFGYTGLLNFGQIAFAMLGGFGIAISVSKWGLPFWLGVVIGLLLAVVLALLLGLPTLRLRADYLAIVTIAAAEALRLTFRSVSATPITNSTLDGDTCRIDDPLNAITFTNATTVKQQVSSGPITFTGPRTLRVT